MVLGELGRPSTAVAVGPTQQMGMQTLQAGVRRLDRAERRLLELYGASGIASRVMASADLGPQGAPDPAYVVAYRVLNYDEHFDGPDGQYWLGFVFGSITAGLGWLIAIDAHANSSHSFEFEVRVFDVRGAPMVRVTQTDGTIQNVYDTSVAAPLMRRTYTGNMHTWIAPGTGGPGGTDLDAFMDAQGDEVARVMYDLSAEDVGAAIPRSSRAASTLATSGGERPAVTPPLTATSAVEASARAVVDQLRDVLLACTDGAPMAVTITWTASGEVSLSLTGANAGTPADGCVHAAGAGATIAPAPGTAGTLRHPLH